MSDFQIALEAEREEQLAINQYTTHLEKVEDPKLRKILLENMNDEAEHFVKLRNYLGLLEKEYNKPKLIPKPYAKRRRIGKMDRWAEKHRLRI